MAASEALPGWGRRVCCASVARLAVWPSFRVQREARTQRRDSPSNRTRGTHLASAAHWPSLSLSLLNASLSTASKHALLPPTVCRCPLASVLQKPAATIGHVGNAPVTMAFRTPGHPRFRRKTRQFSPVPLSRAAPRLPSGGCMPAFSAVIELHCKRQAFDGGVGAAHASSTRTLAARRDGRGQGQAPATKTDPGQDGCMLDGRCFRPPMGSRARAVPAQSHVHV